jgi:hypothetical protein
MSALNDYACNIKEEYQHLDFLNSQMSGAVDSIEVNGHSIEFGHNLQSLLAAYQIEGVAGVNDWFEHMAKDFASPEGIPLPFADIIHQMTGLSAGQAVEWLTANLTDAVETGAEAAIMTFFRQNPKAYSICLGLGIAFGLYNSNPMLVAMNGLLYFSKLRKEGRLKDGLWNNADRYIRTSFAMVDRVCTYTFITNTALTLAGGSLSSLTGQVVDALGWGGKLVGTAKLTAAAVCATDVVEGVANFGMSLLIGKAVGKLVEKVNENVKEELAIVEPKVESRRQLIELIRNQAPPETLAPLIELMSENGVYKPFLS